MNLDAVAKRISRISPSHLPVLACLAEGMSNSQIAVKLGYKSPKSVATIIYGIYKTLGLDDVHSRTEKRQLVADAFRKARTDIRRTLYLRISRRRKTSDTLRSADNPPG